MSKLASKSNQNEHIVNKKDINNIDLWGPSQKKVTRTALLEIEIGFWFAVVFAVFVGGFLMLFSDI